MCIYPIENGEFFHPTYVSLPEGYIDDPTHRGMSLERIRPWKHNNGACKLQLEAPGGKGGFL